MNRKIDYSKIYSPSKLDMFSKCPKSYHFYYLDPVYKQIKNELKKLPKNIWSFQTLGKAVHNAITLFYHSPPKERTQDLLVKHLKKTWRSEIIWNQDPPLGNWGGFGTIEEERNSYRQATLMLKNFLKMAEIEPEIEYLPTEDFNRSIDDYKNLITPLSADFDISGKFDLIIKDENENLSIVDFKTGKNDDDDAFQLRFYKILAETNLNKPVQKASFYFLKSAEKKEFDLGNWSSKEIKGEILEKINVIKNTKNFETKPSKLCKFCLFKEFCPEKRNIDEIITGTSIEDSPNDLPF